MKRWTWKCSQPMCIRFLTNWMLRWGLFAWANCVAIHALLCHSLWIQCKLKRNQMSLTNLVCGNVCAWSKCDKPSGKNPKQICHAMLLPFIFHVDVTSLICGMYFMFVISLIRFFFHILLLWHWRWWLQQLRQRQQCGKSCEWKNGNNCEWKLLLLLIILACTKYNYLFPCSPKTIMLPKSYSLFIILLLSSWFVRSFAKKGVRFLGSPFYFFGKWKCCMAHGTALTVFVVLLQRNSSFSLPTRMN